jgi:hypothetical protein
MANQRDKGSNRGSDSQDRQQQGRSSQRGQSGQQNMGSQRGQQGQSNKGKGKGQTESPQINENEDLDEDME